MVSCETSLVLFFIGSCFVVQSCNFFYSIGLVRLSVGQVDRGKWCWAWSKEWAWQLPVTQLNFIPPGNGASLVSFFVFKI